jgi:hypothetical protein
MPIAMHGIIVQATGTRQTIDIIALGFGFFLDHKFHESLIQMLPP